MNQYDHFTAVFRPKTVDDLKPGALGLVGRRLKWQAIWVIEDDYADGRYAGQYACALRSPEVEAAQWFWTPQEDLDEIEIGEGEPPQPRPGPGWNGTAYSPSEWPPPPDTGFPTDIEAASLYLRKGAEAERARIVGLIERARPAWERNARLFVPSDYHQFIDGILTAIREADNE